MLLAYFVNGSWPQSAAMRRCDSQLDSDLDCWSVNIRHQFT